MLDFESKIVDDDFLKVLFEVYLNQIYSITNIPSMMESITLNTIGIVQWPNDQSVTIMWPKLPVASCKIWAKTGDINYKCLRFDDQALLIYMASLIGHLDSLIAECGLMKSLNNKKFPLSPLPSCHLAILPCCKMVETQLQSHHGLNLKWHLQPQAKLAIFEHSHNDV